MLERPGDLPDSSLIAALSAGWGLDAVSAKYLPVGFGSHHWRVVDTRGTTWFVTVDDLTARMRDIEGAVDDARRRLRAALVTARAVADAGASFVVAPVRRRDGEVLGALGETYAIAVYPYLEGKQRPFGVRLSPQDRRDVMTTLAALHATAEPIRRAALVETFEIPQRPALVSALGDLISRWDTGPYGEQTRQLLATHAGSIERLLARHDQLAANGGDQLDRMVLTHGEPHPGNLIETSQGWVLVDWDTALLAPPERDLWSLDPTGELAEYAYTPLTGRAVQRPMLNYYQLSWALNDIAEFVAQFHQPHREDANHRESWAALIETLQSAAQG
jgi:aminoglycoside phosphotransferase (APT) family kinase protein